MPAWLYRLHNSAGECLYVGLTGRHPSLVLPDRARQWEWGDQIDPSGSVWQEFRTDDAARKKLPVWVARWRPIYRAPVRSPRKPPRKPQAPAGALERAARAQARHRMFDQG